MIMHIQWVQLYIAVLIGVDRKPKGGYTAQFVLLNIAVIALAYATFVPCQELVHHAEGILNVMMPKIMGKSIVLLNVRLVAWRMQCQECHVLLWWIENHLWNFYAQLTWQLMMRWIPFMHHVQHATKLCMKNVTAKVAREIVGIQCVCTLMCMLPVICVAFHARELNV